MSFEGILGCCDCGACLLTVCVSCSGSPVVGASVTVRKDFATQASGVTGSDGCVTFDLGVGATLPAGSWDVRATWTLSAINYDKSRPIAGPCDRVEFRCDPVFYAEVRGCARDDNLIGNPVSGATVEFYGLVDNLLDTATSDANGLAIPDPILLKSEVGKVVVTWPWGDARTDDFGGSPFGGSTEPYAVGYSFTDQGADWACCGDCDEPTYLCATATLTDPAGNLVTLTRDPGDNYYYGCHLYTPSDRFFENCQPVGAGGQVAVDYMWYPCNSGLGPLALPLYVRFPRQSGVGTNNDLIPYQNYYSISETNCNGSGRIVVNDCPGGVSQTGFINPGLGANANPEVVTEPDPCSREGGTYSYSANLGLRTWGGSNPDDTVPHPLSYLAGWGTAVTFSVAYPCSPPMPLMAPGPMMAVGPSPGDRPPGPDLLANARECPHRRPIPPGERQGCGCSHRCDAGRGNQPGGATDVNNCWDCPIAPRRSW